MAIRPIIDNKGTLGNSLLLVDIKPAYERIEKNGKFERSSNISHYSYSVVCLERKFEKISIKIEEAQPLFNTDESDIPDNTMVKFENLELKPYVNGNFIQISARADKCIIIKQ
ncbi:hypothetical protein AB1L07_18920 [Niallia alba]|uniref:Uncharacterized protein n=1 Tax=Niallia circulans TaxID=1397 RepID=A0A941GMZ1_NIACI|nr:MULTISPECIES: hypothetical protein [Niallia]MCB5240022.1 hypothetical protein [Niallia circulans]MED3795482.1 hypothetical protein [Niallia alba]